MTGYEPRVTKRFFDRSRWVRAFKVLVGATLGTEVGMEVQTRTSVPEGRRPLPPESPLLRTAIRVSYCRCPVSAPEIYSRVRAKTLSSTPTIAAIPQTIAGQRRHDRDPLDPGALGVGTSPQCHHTR